MEVFLSVGSGFCFYLFSHVSSRQFPPHTLMQSSEKNKQWKHKQNKLNRLWQYNPSSDWKNSSPISVSLNPHPPPLSQKQTNKQTLPHLPSCSVTMLSFKGHGHWQSSQLSSGRSPPSPYLDWITSCHQETFGPPRPLRILKPKNSLNKNLWVTGSKGGEGRVCECVCWWGVLPGGSD